MAEIAARVDLDPRMWCRPVVNAAINPDPLICWLALATAAPDSYPTTLTGMNMGDYPPFSDIDTEQLNAELTRYEQALEAERLEAERQAGEAARRARTTPTRKTPTSSGGSGTGGNETDADGQTGEQSELPADWVNPWEGTHQPKEPMPAECNGAAMYSTQLGGWVCLDH